MESLFAKTPQQLVEILGLAKLFQAKQIYSHLVNGVFSFDRMTDLSLALRAELNLKCPSVFSSSVVSKQTDDSGTIKLALQLEDGFIIECVLLSNIESEKTACLSSQVGCAMGCKFCRTGTMGLKRNLKDYEIVEQFAQLQRLVSQKISHIVFMGMGEPLANIDNVLSAIKFLHDPSGYNISHRRITVSTCGFVPGIQALSKRGVPVKLAVSLVCADDSKRSEIMPVNKSFNLMTLRSSLQDFQKVSGRRFTYEYCMIQNVNIGQQDAENLAKFCNGFEVIVNLIPFNPCPELPYNTPTQSEIAEFTRYLDKLKVNYTIRVSRGKSIRGACGQLAAKL